MVKEGKKEKNKEASESNWRYRQVVMVNSKKRQDQTGKRVKLARQAGSEGKWKSRQERQEQTGKRVKLARQACRQ